MQVLTIIVQNTAAYSDLGAATSGVTFFRTLGGSFGAALFGSIYAHVLAGNLPKAIAKAGLSDPAAAANPHTLRALPEAVRLPIVNAYADALHQVFLFAVPVAAVALIVALILPQVRMRGTAADAARSAGAGFAMPESGSEDDQLEALVARAIRRSGAGTALGVLSTSGSRLSMAQAWGALQILLNGQPPKPSVSQRSVEDRVGLPHGVLTSFFDELVGSEYVSRGEDRDTLTLTAEGLAEVTLIVAAWENLLVGELHEWLPSNESADGRVQGALQRIVTRLVLEEQKPLTAS
jgi:hypothetical protein